MKCRFSFKHMKTSQALIEYAESKITEKVKKYSTKPIEAHITFSVEGNNHIAQCSVKGGDGFNFQASASCVDMYGSVDLLVDKLQPQLKKQKDKLKNHKYGQDNVRHLQVIEIPEKDDCDSIPVEASDLIKFEKAKAKVANQ